jgi:Flp pilus assembly protein TadG
MRLRMSTGRPLARSIDGRTDRRGWRETGAALVEFAFVSLILIGLVAGAWDYGRGWRAGLSATEATRTGARVASGQGKFVQADFAALTGMKANLSSSGQLDNVERVVIFRVTSTNGGTVPTLCKTSNAVAGCHIIGGDVFRAMSTSWNSLHYTSTGCLAAASGQGWCPTNRNATQLNADTVGVYVRLRQSNDFKIIGDSLTIERNAAMRIEPEEST